MMIKMHTNRRNNTGNNITPTGWIFNAWDNDLENKMIIDSKKDRKGRTILTREGKNRMGKGNLKGND